MRLSKNAVRRSIAGRTRATPPLAGDRACRIEPRLRKVMGYRHLPKLRDALQRELKIDTTTSKKEAAAQEPFQLGMGLTPQSTRLTRAFRAAPIAGDQYSLRNTGEGK